MGYKVETEVLQAIYIPNAVHRQKQNMIKNYNYTTKGESKKHFGKHTDLY